MHLPWSFFLDNTKYQTSVEIFKKQADNFRSEERWPLFSGSGQKGLNSKKVNFLNMYITIHQFFSLKNSFAGMVHNDEISWNFQQIPHKHYNN